jgi:hypothetical protein
MPSTAGEKRVPLHVLHGYDGEVQFHDGVGQDKFGEQDGNKHPFADAEEPSPLAVVGSGHVEVLDGPRTGEDCGQACLNDAEGPAGGVGVLPAVLSAMLSNMLSK